METITIDVGVYTALLVDLTEFEFDGVEKVIMTIKNFPETTLPVIVEREYTEAKVYADAITPEESLKLRYGAVYDFNKVLTDGKRYKVGSNGKIELRTGCGQWQKS